MAKQTLIGAGLGGVFLVVATAAAWFGPGPGNPVKIVQQAQQIEAFRQANPKAALSWRFDRIRKVYGPAFSTGSTAAQSAEAFRQGHAGVFGAVAEELVPGGVGANGQGIMYQPQTDSYKFTLYTYTQQRAGIPVFRSELKLLVRNENDYPLVLASANLRDLGGFQIDAQAAPGPLPHSNQEALNRAGEISTLDGQPEVISTRKVIFAGGEDEFAAPVLADEFLIGVGVDRWLIVTDATTGAILLEEHRIFVVDIDGNASGLATQGPAADFCDPEEVTPLPYLLVSAGANNAFTDANGDFTISNPGTTSIAVDANLNGQWFDTLNFAGAETAESTTITPPGPADLLFNSANTDPLVRAQVNGYVHANVIRDWVLQYNATYPFVFDEQNFPVWVNRTDGFCPGNAWYSPPASAGSINFCQTGSGYPNTAWTSVLYHEYGHHLVEAGGSGQGAYGEGMGDVMSSLILDDNRLGIGFFGSCASWLRDADNNCQYSATSCSSCGSESHDCGQLIAGCVWDTRNALALTEPADYLDILASLALNSIFVHSGSSIAPSITIDYLTLDDNDANILNGTPHYAEIDAGFSAHGMDAPEIELLTFDAPSGLPETIAPAGGSSVPITVSSLTATPQPGTGKLFVDTGGGFVEIAMTEGAPNNYDAVFPASTCGESVSYYFTAETTDTDVAVWPSGAPVATFSTLSAGSLTIAFDDDFETDQGWGVSTTASDGPWDRGTPIPNSTCDRGNPGTDADGSGQCYLTDNSSAGSCNSDVDSGSTTLTSPVMDASLPETQIQYWRWYSNTGNGQGSNPFQDTMLVQVTDDGSTWVNLETVGPIEDADGGWNQKTFRIEDFVSATSTFQIRFIASDTDPQSVVEAAVDGIQLINIGCDEEVFGDLDGDNLVAVTDLLILLGAWGPCDDPCPPYCTGDLDQDCQVAVTDLLALLGAWSP